MADDIAVAAAVVESFDSPDRVFVVWQIGGSIEMLCDIVVVD